MRRVIAADERRYIRHYAAKPRHTMQVDYFDYERRMRTKELPAGRKRAQQLGPVALAGRASKTAAGAR
jgi:hypothetical protein